MNATASPSDLRAELRAAGFTPLPIAYPSTVRTCLEMACGHCGRVGQGVEPYWCDGQCRALAVCPVCGAAEEI